MSFHKRQKIRLSGLFVLFAALLIVASFAPRTRNAEAQVAAPTQTVPQQQQARPAKTSATPLPLPLDEEAKIKAFDLLPDREQKAMLEANGPLFPQKYSISNLSMRAFVKGGSLLVLDYALQPNSSVLIRISVKGTEPFSVLQTEPQASGKEVLDRILSSALREGNTQEQKEEALFKAIIEEFLRSPERTRRHTVLRLPENFGATAQVAQITIQAFTKGPGGIMPAHFRLYNLGMGNKAIGSSASIRRYDREMSDHVSSYRFTASDEGEATTALRITRLSPGNISVGRKVNYTVHSLSAFYRVAAVFYREEEGDHESYTGQVSFVDIGSITENGSIPHGGPHRCSCAWDGTSDEGPRSLGRHVLEVRAWETDSEDEPWVWARSYPKMVLVN